MILVGEVKGRQDGLELVENLIVFGHVSGQNTSVGGEKKNAPGYGGAQPCACWEAQRTSSLDDSFPDAFVLICRQISEDVALSLQNREGFVVSVCTLNLTVDAKTTNCWRNPAKYFIRVFYYSRSDSRPWPQSCTWNLCKNQGLKMHLYPWVLYKNCFGALPSRVFQMPQRSDGSPEGRCHCTGVPVQSEHLSAERWASISH